MEKAESNREREREDSSTVSFRDLDLRLRDDYF